MFSNNLREDGLNRYRSIKVGSQKLDDATLNLGSLKNLTYGWHNKFDILQHIANGNIKELRNISNYFYRISGIYQKICNYFSTIYRYDWYVVPEVFENNPSNTNVIKDFVKILSHLDSSRINNICQNIALRVIRDGVYYGYITDSTNNICLQDLPSDYCRCRYNVGTTPAIEFDMRFFDEQFKNINYRMKVLNLFPKEFAKGYMLYKQHKLPPDDITNQTWGSWYLLDIGKAIKFNINDSEIPLFVNAVPAIIDLDMAQDLDRRKQMQKLMKIIVQKLPLDKNGDLIFDVDEAKDIHQNAVTMLANAIGVDVLTTFADIESINTSDSNTTTTKDDLEKVERTVFNNMGTSRNLFNTDGNLSLEKSLLTDAGSIRNLILQFETFFDSITTTMKESKKKYKFRFYMLETTQYNYMELSKLYKEQVQMGYSKMLPQIALGHSQSSIINTAYFENEILQLSSIMIPPLTSSTMSGEDLLAISGKNTTDKNQNNTEDKQVGRPQLEESQKSEKTIQNEESKS